MTDETLKSLVDENGVARLIFNRPESHNSLSPTLVSEFMDALSSFETDDAVRVVVISGEGRSFCAGGDIASLNAIASATYEENLSDARQFSALFRLLHFFPKPTVAQVHGYALAGGTAITACVDIAVASRDAVFGVTEAGLGLVPAVIAPYVVSKIGSSAAHRYLVTAERFDADEAHRIGLIHEVCDPFEVDGVVAGIVDSLLKPGPSAQVAIKRLIPELAGLGKDFDAEPLMMTSAEARMSEEATAGMRAFLAKEPAPWVPTR